MLGGVHLRRRQFLGWEGSKIDQKLPTLLSKNCRPGEGRIIKYEKIADLKWTPPILQVACLLLLVVRQVST